MLMKYLNFKFLLLFFALAMALPPAWAQETLTVANGTSTNGVAPIYGNKFESTGRIQIIYPASMLEDLAGNDITSITFYQKSTSYNISGGVVEMYIRESEESSFQYTTSYGMYAQNTFTKVATVNGITTVFNSADFTYTFTFDEPYSYQGGNLVIEMNIATRGSSNKTEWYGQSTGGTNAIATTYSISGSGNVTTMYPKATFTYELGVLPDYKAKVTPDAIDFGKLKPNETSSQDITVTNKGLNPITPVVTGLTAPFSTTYTPAAIASGETATIPIVFAPTTTGDFDCMFQVGDQGGNIDPVDVIVAGACANEVTVCEGSQTSSYLPLYGFYYDNKQLNQMIYPAGMLEDLQGKKIKSMTFYGTNLALSGGAYNFKVGITEQEKFESKVRITEGLTTVKTVTDGTQTGTELTVVFNEAFPYNGGNLLIEYDQTTKGSNYPSNTFTGIYAQAASFYSYSNSNLTSDGVYSGGSVQDFLPKVTFAYEDAAPVVLPDPELVVEPEELTMTAVAGKTATATFDVLGTDLKGDVTIAVEGEGFSVEPPTIAKDDAQEGATVTVTYAPTAVGSHTATITVSSEDAEPVTVAVTGTATAPEIAAITFSPEAGSYTEYKTVTISCATDDAELTYSTDGGQNWQRNRGSVTVNVDRDMTLMAKAVVAGVEKTATAVYSFEIPEDPITMEALEGYYFIKNNGNNQYANVVGRKTLRFTETPETEAGSVIYVKTNTNGQVQSLRSQACDLQGYANKAMNYVPDFVHLVAQKLELEGVGQLFGENGVDAILDKFNACFDYHLYVEPVDGGYRIYGKTPSMQPVVEFYRENQAKCDAKLPGLEAAINRAIEKILEKTHGSGASILTPFSLHTIWENMDDANLIEPTDDASTSAFYHQVLMNKDYVWSFAYETAMIYWTNLKNHQRYETDIKPMLGEFADYIDKIEQVRPNFKYYIVQKDNKPDFISQGNGDIDAARSIWTVEPRTSFTVNVPEANVVNDEYVTTLYTDFGYTLPEGVTAYKVTAIDAEGYATTEAIGNAVPAQTPVLLKATAAGDKVLTLNPASRDAVEGNLLVGPDYLIGEYQIKTPTIANIFDMVKRLFGEEIYNNYMTDYEHLMLRYAGTVNNKYFWRLSDDEIALCGTTNEYDQVQCVIRSLDVEDGEVAFYDNMTLTDNKAFLVNTDFSKIMLEQPVVEVAAPTFTPEAGSYTAAQTVEIDCETPGAVIYYSIDGGNTWNEGNSVEVGEDMTLMAKAVVAGVETPATAVYSFEFPEDPITMDALEGYYFIKNNGNNQYANVVGRKTLRFTETPETEAGSVIYVKTNTNGQVQSLRSQACDLQGYANKAMNYVPDFVHLVAQKLELEGVGQLFGENGVDAILDKFNACFDYHLYVEPVDGGYRIYGKTPSMQPVVEFYRENQAKCDAKLPGLEAAINRAIEKILEKTHGSGASILTPFSLHTIWENMDDANLIEPTDDASTSAFYHQVLMNKDYVWSFAYETAMIYWTNLKNHQRYETDIKPMLGEFADYIDKIEQVRPNFKYYIVQKDNKPDFISEGNVDIKNGAARTIWTVEERTNFTVNFPEENLVKEEYVTTLYTDFAYTLPEGVTAYKVVGVIDGGIAQLAAIGNTVPAQTPVLLKSTTAGDIELTISDFSGKAPADNLLKGPDYLIRTYQIKSPTVENIFDMVKRLFGEEIYNRYMLDYEHLMLRYSGMVKNKYFLRLSDDEIAMCGTTNEYDQVQCVIRSLDVQDGEVAFYDNMTMADNKAFLVSEEHDKITFAMKDIDRDGNISISDVTALIDILLVEHFDEQPLDAPSDAYPRGLDYEAADFDGNGVISIKDVSELIDFLLMWNPQYEEEEESDD